MILSVDYKFIFVHIPKTAGTALTTALSPYGVTGTRNLWRRFVRRLPTREAPQFAYFRKHETAAAIRDKLGPEIFERFYRFTVVRNPFAHAVSHYEYLKEFRSPRLAERFQAMNFAEYLNYRTTARGMKVPFFTVLPDQTHFLVDGNDRLLVDRIMKFEDLPSELENLAKELRLPSFRLQHVNKTKSKSDHQPYQSYYDATTEDLVRKIYARDFGLLGYSDKLS